MPNEQKKFKFKIGADPEFNICFQDKRIVAENLITNLFKKDKKFKKEEMGYKIEKAGELGWDGASATGELRPTPSNDPKTLTENIGILLKAFVEKVQLFNLITTSEKASVGGHIHFEVGEKRNNTTLEQSIHKKMSSFYLPIMLGENNINLRLRLNQNYGRITDFRCDRKGINPRTEEGGAVTYEFRVPSAEWLTTEHITYSTLAYLATIYNEILHHPKNITKCKDLLITNSKQALAIQELAIAKYTSLSEMILKKIKKYIKTFEFYKQYEQEIDFILHPNKVIAEKKNAEFDAIKGWNFTPKGIPTKRMLTNKKTIKEKLSKIDSDELMGIVPLLCNPDTNIELFGKEIKKRIIAFNWKLNNIYCLFGLKKGIKDYIIMNEKKEYLRGIEQIETMNDSYYITGIFNRIKDKYNLHDIGKKTIIIGMPYEDRIKENTNKFIEIIVNIEKEILKPQQIKPNSLKDDRNLPEEQQGKIWNLYNKTENDEIRFVTSSEEREAIRNITDVNNELQTEESTEE
jgi:hypothetical protein